jgi:hypothetical protein
MKNHRWGEVEAGLEVTGAIDTTTDIGRQIKSAETSPGRTEPTSNPTRSVQDEMTYGYKVVSSRTSHTGVVQAGHSLAASLLCQTALRCYPSPQATLGGSVPYSLRDRRFAGGGGPGSLLSLGSYLPPLAASVEPWGYRLCQRATHLTLLGNHRIGGSWSP